jgi:hypothetical protein
MAFVAVPWSLKTDPSLNPGLGPFVAMPSSLQGQRIMDVKCLTNTQTEYPDTMDCGLQITIRSMAMSAHDLKNLLTGILLLTERIPDGTRKGDGSTHLGHGSSVH